MKVSVRWGTVILATVVALGGFVSAVHAQFRLPVTAPLPAINPTFNTTPGLQIYSNLYNAAVLGRTIRQIPPYALGYNPYPSPIINTAPTLNTIPYAPGVYSPGMLSGYPTGYNSSASLTTNPYGYDNTLSSSSYGNNSYNGYNPYGAYDPAYGFLSGASDVINATGNYYKNVQQARLTQSQADESRIDYRRRLIDEARYERGLLPTTEELRQQDLARDLARAPRAADLGHHLGQIAQRSAPPPDERRVAAERPRRPHSGRRTGPDQRDQPES